MANPNPSPKTRFTSENQPANSGRKTGSRDKLSRKFFEDLATVWEERGIEALRKMSDEGLAKLTGSQQTKEVEVKNTVDGMSEERLDQLIEMANAERERRQSTEH